MANSCVRAAGMACNFHPYCLAFLVLLTMPALLFPATTVAQVAGSYVEPHETYEMTRLVVGGIDYWIITIDGVETFMIGSDAQIIKDKSKIAAVLIQNLKETSGIAEKTQQIRDRIHSFNQSQYPERTVCERTTGVDAMPCYDKETCIKACYRVPLCAMQIREDLIMAIMGWNAERKNVDAAVLAAKERAQNPQTEQDYRDLSSLIQNMSDTMKIMESNPLYIYPYCEKMNATHSDAKSAMEISNSIAATLSTISQVNIRAENIYGKMTERITYWGARENMYREKYNAVLDGYNELKSSYSKVGWEDNETWVAINNAENYSTDVWEYKEKGSYKLAIKQADQYISIISKLKMDVQMTDAQYNVFKGKASQVLANINGSKQKLNGTKYWDSLIAYEEEVNSYLAGKVQKRDISGLITRMDDVDNAVKNMLAEAVLSGNGNDGNGGTPLDVPGFQVPADKTVDDGKGSQNVLCSIINTISSLLGFSIDFLRLCR